MSFDVLMRGATVIDAGVARQLDVGVTDGLIAALGPKRRAPGPPAGRLLTPAIEMESP